MKDIVKIVIDKKQNCLKKIYNAVLCYPIKVKSKIKIFFKICLSNSN